MTGYKVIRTRMKGGKPTGVCEDFYDRLRADRRHDMGPAGIAVARDGAPLVSDDANGTIFRITRNSSR
jgi:glucose/arabinose dehydrogenase